jgi:selenide,water dikinase
VLGKLARQHDPNVLVGFDTADDAGVYRIAPSLALVQTVDFFTPVVDDPFTFGQIAAVNSLSDIYAMGGRPLSSLAIVCFPEKGDLEILERILAGGLSKMSEAHCTVLGGHSVRDEDIKFGYAVTGTIHPDRVLTNAGAHAGDRLLLTKALGTGVISTAIKRGKAEAEWIAAATASMTQLNKTAAEVITRGDNVVPAVPAGKAAAGGSNESITQSPDHSIVSAATDITGFGLLGHAREFALASNVSLRIRAAAFQNQATLLPGALECVRAGFIPGGLKANREFVESCVSFAPSVPEELRTLLYDPQTAGGLLLSVAPDDAAKLISALHSAGVNAVEIGEVLPKTKPLIAVE